LTRQVALPPTLAPRLIGREAAAAYACLSPTKFDELVKDGLLPKARQLTPYRKAWDVKELDAHIDQLPHEGENPALPGFDDRNVGWE